MNTQELRETRGIRRRKALIDLNVDPRDQEAGTSASVRAAPTVPSVNIQGGSVPSQPLPTMIDVDALEDDVIESSASAFAEALSKSSGARRRRSMGDVESGGTTRSSANISNKRRRIPPNQPVIDCDDVPVSVSSSQTPAPPPDEPKYSCPICLCPFSEEMSTKCGHIFCKGCIKMAITRQGKCPTCRKKVTAKELIRVFLPTTR